MTPFREGHLQSLKQLLVQKDGSSFWLRCGVQELLRQPIYGSWSHFEMVEVDWDFA
jgi:hypothetical protein